MTLPRVVKIGEAADEAWYNSGAPGDYAWPVGVIAALALCGQADPAGPSPAKLLAGASDGEIVRTLEEIWAAFWIARPDLAFRCEPIAGWTAGPDPDDHTVRGLARVARAVVKAGLLDITLNLGESRQHDVLGHAWQLARSKRARSATGEFYTPESLCEAMAEMILGDCPEPGQKIMEPALGTGGMFRAAAQVLRRRGKDPADYWWAGNDVSHTAIACAAVNAHLWGLGPRVLLGVADSLAEPDWQQREWDRQQGALEHARDLAGQAAVLAAFRRAAGLVGAAANPRQAAPEPRPAPVLEPLPPGPGVSLALFDGDPQPPAAALPANGSARPRATTPARKEDPDTDDALTLF